MTNYKLIELKFLELHVKKVRKGGEKIKIGDNESQLLHFDTQKNDILNELRNVKYKDLEDLVYRTQLTFDEIMHILDLEYISTKRTGSSPKPNVYQISDINDTLKNILPHNVEISVTVDEKT